MSVLPNPEDNAHAGARERLTSLDAIRGIAALIVLLYHFNLFFDLVNLYGRHSIPYRIFFAGPSAVYLFFVLSGFVLFIAFSKNDNFIYIHYIIKRLIRLYIPLSVAVIISAALYLITFAGPVDKATEFFNKNVWTDYPDLSILFGHLALLDPKPFQSLDGVMWSLVQEIRISVIFPVIAIGILRVPKTTLGLSLAISLTGFYYANDLSPLGIVDLSITARFVFLFAAGAWLAAHRDKLAAGQFSNWLVLWLGVCMVLLIMRGAYAPLLMSVGAILLVAVAAANSSLKGALSTQPFAYLGRISFSLYLIHMVVLQSVIHGFSAHLNLPELVVLSFLMSFVAAELFYRFVEYPSLRFARWAADRLVKVD